MAKKLRAELHFFYERVQITVDLPGFTFLIDDQRRVDGEIRTYPEEFSFDDIVKINVGGIIYETRRSTLKYVTNPNPANIRYSTV